MEVARSSVVVASERRTLRRRRSPTSHRSGISSQARLSVSATWINEEAQFCAYLAYVPEPIKKELKKLQLDDLKGLKEVAKKYQKIDSVEEFLKELKKESPELAEIAKELLEKAKDKLDEIKDALKPQSKDFFKQVSQ